MLLSAFALLAAPAPTDLAVPEDFATIQEALDAAETGDRVLVGPGTWNEVLFIDTPGITLIGAGMSDTILDGGGVDRVLDVAADDFELALVTVENGLSSFDLEDGQAVPHIGGAGLRVLGDGLQLRDVWFEGNVTEFEGRGTTLFVDGDGVEIARTTFFANGGNEPTSGGTASLIGDGHSVTGTTFEYNSTYSAPCMGLHIEGQGSRVRACLFDSQFGAESAASLLLLGSEHTVQQCDFIDTQGEFFGAIDCTAEDCRLEDIYVAGTREGSLRVSGSTTIRGLTIHDVSSNYGDAGLLVVGSGGGSADRVVIDTGTENGFWQRGLNLIGTTYALHDVLVTGSNFNAPIRIVDSEVLIEGCTIADCVLPRKGDPGTLSIQGESIVTVRDSVFWNPDLSTEIEFDAPGLTFEHCLVRGAVAGTDMIVADDPMFQGGSADPLIAYAPHMDSPLVDAGDPSLPGLRLDVAGGVRIIDGDQDGTARVDVGAIEATQTRLSLTTPLDGVARLRVDGPAGAVGVLFAGAVPRLAPLGAWGILCMELDESVQMLSGVELVPFEVALPPEALGSTIAQGLAFDIVHLIGQVTNPLLLPQPPQVDATTQ